MPVSIKNRCSSKKKSKALGENSYHGHQNDACLYLISLKITKVHNQSDGNKKKQSNGSCLTSFPFQMPGEHSIQKDFLSVMF